MSRAAGTELNLSFSGARSLCLAGNCRLDVGDRHNGVGGSPFSGERLCRMEDGRRGLAGVWRKGVGLEGA
jgi:hypothetical protein